MELGEGIVRLLAEPDWGYPTSYLFFASQILFQFLNYIMGKRYANGTLFQNVDFFNFILERCRVGQIVEHKL